jgi:putative transposase
VPRAQRAPKPRALSPAAKLPRYGYKRLCDELRAEGFRVNPKRIRRLYKLAGLEVRRRKRKRLATMRKPMLTEATRPNERWSMDFMLDALASGRRIRTLNVLDNATRECLAIEVDYSIPGARVARVLDDVLAARGAPTQILVDNGPEFTGRDLGRWARERGVELVFSRPGKPVDNAFIESLSGRFRDECLNEHWFIDLHDAKRTAASYRDHYNHKRRHSGLGSKTPIEYAKTFGLHL